MHKVMEAPLQSQLTLTITAEHSHDVFVATGMAKGRDVHNSSDKKSNAFRLNRGRLSGGLLHGFANDIFSRYSLLLP